MHLSCSVYCSWAGILDVNQHMVRLAETLWDWDKWRQQWRQTDVLLVDEISMVGADTIEKVRVSLLHGLSYALCYVAVMYRGHAKQEPTMQAKDRGMCRC